MEIIDGKKISEQLNLELKKKLNALQKKIEIKLVVILIGDSPASGLYVKNKEKKALEVGINSKVVRKGSQISEKNLIELIEIYNQDDDIDGILVQLPLPDHIDSKTVIDKIDPLKDVDGFSAINMGLLALGRPNIIPCTPLGCFKLLETFQNVEGKDVIIIGRSNIVGKPLAYLLTNKNATVTLAHSKTKNLKEKTSRYDIIVSAVGIPNLVEGSWIKENSTVIDVGINYVTNTQGKKQLVGDVDFESVKDKAKYITPVPGGIGPMTIHGLLNNTFQLALKRRNINSF